MRDNLRVRQHVISAWLLRDFAGSDAADTLAVYDKSIDGFRTESSRSFLVRIDAHSDDVERRIGKIEAPAARAARSLVGRALGLAPGIARIAERDENAPEAASHAGTAAGFHIVVANRAIGPLTDQDRRALGRFMTLMFARSPKVTRAIGAIAATYSSFAHEAAVRAGLPMDVRLESAREIDAVGKQAATRALEHVRPIGAAIAGGSWWILRANHGERFVLGDTPTAAAVALGHAATFRPLLGESSFVLSMPLHPEVAVLVTPQPVLPVSGASLDFVGAVNRASWFWSERYVVAQDASVLQELAESLGLPARRNVMSVPYDRERLRIAVAGDFASVLATGSRRPHVDACPGPGIAVRTISAWYRQTRRFPE